VLIIFRGRLIKAKSDFYSVVKTKGALLRVWWAGDTIPPMIYQTRIVCGVGKLTTMNSGEIFRVKDAVPFKPEHKYWKTVNPIYNYLWNFLEDPEQWCDPHHLAKYKLVRIDKTDPDPDYQPGGD